jgi:hypothetical protein
MGPPGTVGLDKHGCSYLFSTSSCNNPPWRPDAGDAASDVKDGASDEDGGDARTGDL